MAIYFTAPNDGAAIAAVDDPPKTDETFEADVLPDGKAFSALLDLVFGEGADVFQLGARNVVTDVELKTQRMFALGPRICEEVGNLDQDELQDLATPWSSSDAFKGVRTDPFDFVTNLQHACRNALAKSGDVYAMDVENN